MKGKVVNVSWKFIQERHYFLEHNLIFPEQKYSNAPSQVLSSGGGRDEEKLRRKMVEMLNGQTKSFSLYPRERGITGTFYFGIYISTIYKNRIVE